METSPIPDLRQNKGQKIYCLEWERENLLMQEGNRDAEKKWVLIVDDVIEKAHISGWLDKFLGI